MKEKTTKVHVSMITLLLVVLMMFSSVPALAEPEQDDFGAHMVYDESLSTYLKRCTVSEAYASFKAPSNPGLCQVWSMPCTNYSNKQCKKLAAPKAGTTVTILQSIVNTDDTVFYKVSYDSDSACMTGYVFKGNASSHDNGACYITDKCKTWPVEVVITTTKADTIWSLPCSSKTNAFSTKVKAAKANETYTATAIVKNSISVDSSLGSGHYFYKITVDGKTGYIWGDSVTTELHYDGKVSISGVSAPSGKRKPVAMALKGTITSTNLNIFKVETKVINTKTGKSVTGGSQDAIHKKSYSIAGKAPDGNCKLAKANDATVLYNYTIEATIRNYYSDGLHLWIKDKVVQVYKSEFWVGADKPTGATYTVKYNANGGGWAPSDQLKAQNQTLKLRDDELTRASELYATYTITLDPNGGNVDASSLKAYNFKNYSFSKWNTKADGSGTSYSPGASYTANANVTLYAQWTSGNSINSVYLPTPARDGYTFDGWGTRVSATSGYKGIYTPSGSLTLYAIWTKNGQTNPIAITEHPASLTVQEGEPAVFTVKATGDNLEYQWYFVAKDGTTNMVSQNGTSNVLEIVSNIKWNGYQYFCEVYNTGESVRSNSAMLTVIEHEEGPDDPDDTKELPFADVSKSKPYYNALYWAYTEGIVKGKSETRFAPNDYLTRGEFCTMLWRMWGKQSVEGMTCPFADAQKSNHYRAILWCYNKGIINGYKVDGKQVFKPGKTITRGNILIMLFKLAKQEEGYRPASVSNPFTDVKDTNKNISAYKWAYENQVTTTTKLQTGADCKRWAMVSFLYGYNNAYHVKD